MFFRLMQGGNTLDHVFCPEQLKNRYDMRNIISLKHPTGFFLNFQNLTERFCSQILSSPILSSSHFFRSQSVSSFSKKPSKLKATSQTEVPGLHRINLSLRSSTRSFFPLTPCRRVMGKPGERDRHAQAQTCRS